ncbi:hypothetical protein Q4566_04305 [Tamlana sp. 2_MG-2023]|uniref:hypothetical protein n=1 Tax=unclassified Tamlana TaxID=2614803 RepID=UPI0026E13AF5|nr:MULTISPECIES: hypothetical protein [unclassified Tamlana]MDO6759413.1 hypothetical protein [Tamlana sp. 2_MG-2023]MDO6790448.1 hypothetical protein [Tamlana sp. 1_MG-2023]
MKTTFNLMMLTVLLLLVTTSCNNEDLFVDTNSEEIEVIITEEKEEGIELNENEFTFIPERWGIVEGKVSDDVARSNRDILEAMMIKAKSNGITTFKIDKMDAYFKVDGPLNEGTPEIHAINIPSDFKLKMTNDTHLRMQPNGHFRPTLLGISNENNITIQGGVLHGDREEHNYNSGYVDSDGATGGSHEWGHTMRIKGGKNIVIDGVVFQDATGDGLNISSIYHYFDSRHIRAENITIKNSKFLRARRINLSLTNCENIVIQDNEFIDGGVDMAKSKGTSPSCQFNIEPVRERDANNNLIEYERVNNIFVSGNKGIISGNYSGGGGFFVSHGNGPIIFEKNDLDSGIGFATADGVIIRNNIARGSISAGKTDNYNRVDFVFGNEVYENTVYNGVYVGGNGVLLRDNYIEGETGIYLGAGGKNSSVGVSNSVIKNNTIKASDRGIISINTTTNTIIEGNKLEMLSGSSFALNLNNAWTGSGKSNYVVNNNEITGTRGNDSGAHASIIGANSIEVTNNKLGCVIMNQSQNILFKGNTIDAEINKNGLLFNYDCQNSTFEENKIIIYTSKTPLNIKAIEVKNGVNLSSSVLINKNDTIER